MATAFTSITTRVSDSTSSSASRIRDGDVDTGMSARDEQAQRSTTHGGKSTPGGIRTAGTLVAPRR
jgi:hypothetical protein